MVHQKVPKLYFQSYENINLEDNFIRQKSTEFFQKKNSSKNFNLGEHFLLKTLFSRLNF